MDGRFGAQRRQHLEVVVPKEELGVTGIDPRQVALVPGHAPSVLCAVVQTPSLECRSTSGA